MATFLQPKQYASIGVLQKTRGLAGEMIVLLSYPTLELPVKHVIYLYRHATYLPYIAEAWETEETHATLHLQGIESRSQAQKLRGSELFVDEACLPDLLKGTCFELLGFEVIEQRNKRFLGHITDVMYRKFQPLLLIKNLEGKEWLLPYHCSCVLAVYHDARQVDIDLLEGFVEE